MSHSSRLGESGDVQTSCFLFQPPHHWADGEDGGALLLAIGLGHHGRVDFAPYKDVIVVAGAGAGISITVTFRECGLEGRIIFCVNAFAFVGFQLAVFSETLGKWIVVNLQLGYALILIRCHSQKAEKILL